MTSISDICCFPDDLQEMEISDHDILVSYDVSLHYLTNVHVDESIRTLARKAFKDDWFLKESHPTTLHCARLLLLLSGVLFQLIPNMGMNNTAYVTGKFCHQQWRSWRSANARKISIFQMEICLTVKWR